MWNRPITTPLFVFELPRPVVPMAGVDRRRPMPSFDPTRGHRVARTLTPTSERHSTPFTKRPTTQKVSLNACEMRALAALNDLGADLREDLSLPTLRRAFRRLARRYHPDRHPGTSAAEQQRLAHLFAEAMEHYGVLSAALAGHVD
jgi:hypothetical protein